MDQPVIGIVCGTRPEIIKLAPVYHALRAQGWARVVWVHTGQHADMAEHMLGCFDIVPDLRLTRSGAGIEQFSIECRAQLGQLMAAQPWDMCVVQGDTESAFLGALCAFYRRIPVAHVEAGLRTYNLERPFPEEGLRQMISRITALHFAPTERARDALLREGLRDADILVTGNTVVDAQLWTSDKYGIKREPGASKGPIVVTVHRREHWGGEMQEIFEAVAEVAREHPDRQVRFPVHLNPVVQRAARDILGDVPNVELTAPFDYLEMQRALAGASLVLTDSGGLQEEAPTFGVPVLVLRHETERPECVEAGCAALVGPHREGIVREVRRLLNDELAWRRMQASTNPFGDGRASQRIADVLAAHLVPVPSTEAVAA
ncbi:non-hydrolyzing UDP-N-acetylglucosamine 2-epimerase [Ramlibacter albus]|uniref:non-hydrolyzing UDP-N-acetylglucosamine 2-epimerase n=1 Tax=Ramlibacter albus TaxID=2079448 RepID=UPI00338F8503